MVLTSRESSLNWQKFQKKGKNIEENQKIGERGLTHWREAQDGGRKSKMDLNGLLLTIKKNTEDDAI